MSSSTDGGLTWTTHLAWQGRFDPTTNTGDNASKIFPALAVDRAGQVHVVLSVRHHDNPLGFVTDCETNPTCSERPQRTDLYLVTSPDGAATWTDPFRLSLGSASSFFPWIAAGSRGRVDVAYYRSPSLRPNDPASNWFIRFAQVGAAKAVVSGGVATYLSVPVGARPPAFARSATRRGPSAPSGSSAVPSRTPTVRPRRLDRRGDRPGRRCGRRVDERCCDLRQPDRIRLPALGSQRLCLVAAAHGMRGSVARGRSFGCLQDE